MGIMATHDKNPKDKPHNATIHFVGNAHIDPVWLWRWPEEYQETRVTFRSALDRMKEFPGFIFTASQAAIYRWIEESDPGMFEEIRQRVKEGRWAIVNGWWMEPDCNIPGGESFARQSLYGQRYFQQKFGKTCLSGYCVDSFGHNGMLPQLLLQGGFKCYVPIWNVILLMNFFRNIPKELDEAATIDGANPWDMLFLIYLPISLPALATVTFFSLVGHWNSWFVGLILMNNPANYPLQTYIQQLVIAGRMDLSTVSKSLISQISDSTLNSAKLFISIILIMLIFPFLQKYFVYGITLGSIKE